MMTIMRTIIDINEKDLAILDRFSKKNHSSRAAVIRKAVTLFIQEHIQASEKSAFGIWKDKKVDALSYQEKLRDEWKDR